MAVAISLCEFGSEIDILMNVAANKLRGQQLCVGCGTCAVICPTRAIHLDYRPYSEFHPQIDPVLCTDCGLCLEKCPVNSRLLEAAARDAETSADPLTLGLQNASFFLAYDKNQQSRMLSASGGITTSLLQEMLNSGMVDAVIHAEAIFTRSGESHFQASISRTAADCHRKRSSFYGPLSYEHVLKEFRNKTEKLAITGVPCVLRGLSNLFTTHPDYRDNKTYLIGLACSHNVNGQFTDYLAESFNIPKDRPFKINFRDKHGIPHATHYNTTFIFEDGSRISRNRFDSPFNTYWRKYCFALYACHYCADFWAEHADVSIKDAWGKWATEPAGKSILVCRHPEIRSLLDSMPSISFEPLLRHEVATCQTEANEYKQLTILSRFQNSLLAKKNRQSRFSYYYLSTWLSRYLYARSNFALTSFLLQAFLKVWPFGRKGDYMQTPNIQRRLRALLHEKLRGHQGKLIIFGTGKMAADIAMATQQPIEFFVDNDTRKHGSQFCGKSVASPELLKTDKGSATILVASSYVAEINDQLESYGFVPGQDFVNTHELYKEARKAVTPRVSLRRLFIFNKVRRFKKIIVLGGYGFSNTGDEAQLNANLQEITERYPDHMIKVLTPNPHKTHFEHNRCQVAEAPRVAFYDYGETPLYDLNTPWRKIQFLALAFWLYLNCFLVRAGLPTFFLSARRSSLLYDLATTDLVFFSGGGYLTGSTLSRLWDGLFFIVYANLFAVPVFLSGQTIGVWDSLLTRKLAHWGFSKATLIATRDSDESPKALQDIAVEPEKIMITYDDALFCDKEENQANIGDILTKSGLDLTSGQSEYISLNMHFWHLNSYSERQELLGTLTDFVKIVTEETGLPICAIPMVPSDKAAMQQLFGKIPGIPFRILQYDYDFRVVRSVIARSKVCITMKHHPIIFAMGEGIPAISLAKGAYYHHKNAGALRLFGLEQMNLDLDSADAQETFRKLLLRSISKRDEIQRQIRESYSRLQEKHEDFMTRMKTTLNL